VSAVSIRRAFFDYPSAPAHKLLTDNRERAQWQSRHNLPDPPQLTDLSALAREIRKSWR
jgi:hypothetical protein